MTDLALKIVQFVLSLSSCGCLRIIGDLAGMKGDLMRIILIPRLL